MKHTEKNSGPLSTGELMDLLRSSRNTDDLARFTQSLPAEERLSSFAEYIHQKLLKTSTSESELIRASQLQRNYAYQILSGSKNPGRDKALSLCLAAEMDLAETQRALTLANLGPLYPRRQRDSVLIFALEHSLSVQETNELLYEMGEEPLNG